MVKFPPTRRFVQRHRRRGSGVDDLEGLSQLRFCNDPIILSKVMNGGEGKMLIKGC